MCIMILAMVACVKKDYTVPEKNRDEMFELLDEGDWQQYGKGYTLGFSQEGGFYYDWDGNPVGYSDYYEAYTYDGNGNICITTPDRNAKFPDIKASILYIDDMTLVLKFDENTESEGLEIEKGEVLEFFNMDYLRGKNGIALNPSPGTWEVERCDKCTVKDYSLYACVMAVEENEIKVAPGGYDGDMSESYKEFVRKIKLSEDVKFYSLSTNDYVSADYEVEHNCENKEMTLEEAMYNPDNSSREAYIFYNKDYEIEKVIFYGGIIIYE